MITITGTDFGSIGPFFCPDGYILKYIGGHFYCDALDISLQQHIDKIHYDLLGMTLCMVIIVIILSIKLWIKR